MITKFREYTIHPILGETVTKPMDMDTPFESFLDIDTFEDDEGAKSSFAFVDCYNIYYLPPNRTSNYPIVTINGTRFEFGGYLTSNENGMMNYKFESLEANKYYVSLVCSLTPSELVIQLNQGNYLLSNMPGAIWVRGDYYTEDKNGNPSTTVKITGGQTFYSTIGLSAYIKYISKVFGTASYTPYADCVPKYSNDTSNDRLGIIQTNKASWDKREDLDCLNFSDLDSSNEKEHRSIPLYSTNGCLTSNEPISDDEVLIKGQLSNSTVKGKVPVFDSNGLDTNVTSSEKVNHQLILKADSGDIPDYSFDGSNEVTLQISKSFVGLGNVGNYSPKDLPLVTERNTELFDTFQTKVLGDSTEYQNKVMVSNGEGVISVSGISLSQLNQLNILSESNKLLSTQDKGIPNGVCPLDSGARIPLYHLPLQSTKLMGFFSIDESTETAYIRMNVDGVSTRVDLEYGNVPTDSNGTPLIDNGFCYICANLYTEPITITNLDNTSSEYLVQSGDRLYALVQNGVVTWGLQRDSDVVSSVCGKIGEVTLQPSDIKFNNKGLDNEWVNHTYKSVKSDIDSKLNKVLSVASSILVTDPQGVITVSSVNSSKLNLLQQVPNGDALISSSQVSEFNTNESKVVKTKSSGFLDKSLFNPSMRIGLISVKQLAITNNVMLIRSSDYASFTDNVKLSNNALLIFLPSSETWTSLAMQYSPTYKIENGQITVTFDSEVPINRTNVEVNFLYQQL